MNLISCEQDIEKEYYSDKHIGQSKVQSEQKCGRKERRKYELLTSEEDDIIRCSREKQNKQRRKQGKVTID